MWVGPSAIQFLAMGGFQGCTEHSFVLQEFRYVYVLLGHSSKCQYSRKLTLHYDGYYYNIMTYSDSERRTDR